MEPNINFHFSTGIRDNHSKCVFLSVCLPVCLLPFFFLMEYNFKNGINIFQTWRKNKDKVFSPNLHVYKRRMFLQELSELNAQAFETTPIGITNHYSMLGSHPSLMILILCYRLSDLVHSLEYGAI